MSFEIDKASMAKLKGVHPDLVRVLIRASAMSDIPFRVTEGMRTLDRQKQLVAKGMSKTLNSRHLTGHAVDLVPLIDLNDNGKFETNELYAWPSYYKLAPIIKAAAKAERVPLEWGGDWSSFKDGPHWQLPFKAYPKSSKTKTVADLAPPMTIKTDQREAVEQASMTGAVGLTGAASSIGPALPDMVEAVSSQQGELSSGDWTRIVIAGVVLALTVYLIWRKVR